MSNMDGRTCSQCNTGETYIMYRNSKAYPLWYKNPENQDEFLCRSCYDRTIHSPDRNPRRILFGSKRITLPFNPRRGICTIIGCTESITDRHHFEYIPISPIFMSVELCDTHHKEETSKQQEMGDEYIFIFR